MQVCRQGIVTLEPLKCKACRILYYTTNFNGCSKYPIRIGRIARSLRTRLCDYSSRKYGAIRDFDNWSLVCNTLSRYSDYLELVESDSQPCACWSGSVYGGKDTSPRGRNVIVEVPIEGIFCWVLNYACQKGLSCNRSAIGNSTINHILQYGCGGIGLNGQILYLFVSRSSTTIS